MRRVSHWKNNNYRNNYRNNMFCTDLEKLQWPLHFLCGVRCPSTCSILKDSFLILIMIIRCIIILLSWSIYQWFAHLTMLFNHRLNFWSGKVPYWRTSSSSSSRSSDKHISKEMFSTEVFLNDLQNNINPSFECLKWTSDKSSKLTSLLSAGPVNQNVGK